MKVNKFNIFSQGKNTVPRFLYHITDMEGFEGIQKKQRILKTQDTWSRYINGVFMVDLRNYTKRWASDCTVHTESKARDMLWQCAHGDRDLVIFRIPTANLDKDELIIRSQKVYFRDKNSKKHTEHSDYGVSARWQKLYSRRKEPIEFVYTKAIDLKDVEVLGVAKNYKRLLRQGGLKAVLTEFFKGQPEMNCVNLISAKK